MITYILTGGTIGSSIGEDGIARPTADVSRLIADDSQLRVPYNILSENLDGKHLNLLIEETAAVIKEGVSEGIIITHGSDTLQYSAAMLDMVFSGADLPIVLVAANYVLTDARSNGKANLYFAQRFIKEKRSNGIFVCYKNDGEAVKIHRGRDVLPHEAFSDALKSVGGSCFAEYCYDKDMSAAVYKQNGTESRDDRYIGSIPVLDDPGCVLRIEPYPGMVYPVIGNGVKAVLLGSYHSGTVGIGDDLKCFLSAAKDKGIDVYLCGLSRAGTEYESISTYDELGINAIYDVSPVYAYCMLWLKYSTAR